MGFFIKKFAKAAICKHNDEDRLNGYQIEWSLCNYIHLEDRRFQNKKFRYSKD